MKDGVRSDRGDFFWSWLLNGVEMAYLSTQRENPNSMEAKRTSAGTGACSTRFCSSRCRRRTVYVLDAVPKLRQIRVSPLSVIREDVFLVRFGHRTVTTSLDIFNWRNGTGPYRTVYTGPYAKLSRSHPDPDFGNLSATVESFLYSTTLYIYICYPIIQQEPLNKPEPIV